MTGAFVAARITPVGRGAVATIRLKGDFSDPSAADLISRLNLLFSAANGRMLCEQPEGKIAFGRWGRANFEELVVCRIDARTLEIHCHGGDAAVQRILTDLAECGCVVNDWRHSTVAAEDFLDVECLEALIQTSTWRTTRIVLEQSGGLLKRTFEQMFSSESSDRQSVNKAIDDLLNWANFGFHLTIPWSVVLTGRPNVGKSSLINALLGYERAIVFDQPGTTRDVVTGETAFEGWPVILADTAGIRNSLNPLETAGIKRAHEQVRQADLRLLLIDASLPPTAEDRSLISQTTDAIVVAHKSDLPNCWNDALLENAIKVSSVTNEGLMELQRQIVRRLIPVVPEAGTPIPVTQRQVAILQEARLAGSAEDQSRILQQLFSR